PRLPADPGAPTGLPQTPKSQHKLPEAGAEYRETKAWFPDDAVARNGLAETLKARHKLPEAEAEYREAKARFPDDAVARTGLAETLKARHKLPEAEAEYRETKARFPDDAVARNGLAETLKAQNKLLEAEAEYRETKARFPDNAHARTGLAETLKAQNKLPEAEAEYRETLARFPGDSYAHTGLTGMLKARQGEPPGTEYPETPAPPPKVVYAYSGPARRFAQNKLAETKAEYRGPNDMADTGGSEASPMEPSGEMNTDGSPPAPTDRAESGAASRAAPAESALDRREIEIIANDAFLVRGWARSIRAYSPDRAPGHFRDRAEALLQQLLPASEGDSVAAGEAALLELDRGEREQARALLRRAVEHFPGSARVRYALARAERETPRGDPITPWRRLMRLDEHYLPLFFLGAARAYLNRADDGDDRAAEQAREKLGRLAYWICQHIAIDTDREPGDSKPNPRLHFRVQRQGKFAGWWAREVQAELFGLMVVKGFDDLGDLDPIREHASTHSSQLDRLEEELVLRHARA
ncbi:MAG: tetratricopeptide repeat protein, partial [Candidatus Thiosymbion ectosymbiont of Robbea hypermnestra]|nr:tetratricopeptide repeat protein [Candidatus Thiosymbion ectosymbiont of Robbea hypermnestra]